MEERKKKKKSPPIRVYKSHQLSPGHGILRMSRIPVGKIVHVSAGVHRWAFGGHAHVPDCARRSGSLELGRPGLSIRSAGPALHDLLVLGSFVLEPYFNLKVEKKNTKKKGNKKYEKRSHTAAHRQLFYRLNDGYAKNHDGECLFPSSGCAAH